LVGCIHEIPPKIHRKRQRPQGSSPGCSVRVGWLCFCFPTTLAPPMGAMATCYTLPPGFFCSRTAFHLSEQLVRHPKELTSSRPPQSLWCVMPKLSLRLVLLEQGTHIAHLDRLTNRAYTLHPLTAAQSVTNHPLPFRCNVTAREGLGNPTEPRPGIWGVPPR